VIQVPIGDEAARERFGVRDLVLIALLAAAGGVLSTYIGYLGNLINRLFGVPFGAGQLIAGLHVVWALLARLLIGRFGSGTLTGLLKGAVEFLSGGTHGVVVLLVSLVEGLLVDVGTGILQRRSLVLTMVAGAIASASNVFIFQAIYFSGVSVHFILVMAGLAFVSGAVFGGYLAWDVERLLVASRVVRRAVRPVSARPRNRARRAATLGLIVALLGGGVYYYVSVYDPFASPDEVRVEGAVDAPFTFRYGDWDGEKRTVNAELRGSATYVPPRDYVGIPLAEVVEAARPRAAPTIVRAIAGDGYEAAFDWAAIRSDSDVLLTLEEGRLRLVAPGYDGAYWVRRVTRLVVE
jgi:ABC-type thiamin/hydroxymethylpyrimidine transport system permease subunit